MRRRFREVIEIQECKNERNLPYYPYGCDVNDSEPIPHKSVHECKEFWDMMTSRILGI